MAFYFNRPFSLVYKFWSIYVLLLYKITFKFTATSLNSVRETVGRSGILYGAENPNLRKNRKIPIISKTK